MYIYLEINLRRMINYIFHNSKRESYVEREREEEEAGRKGGYRDGIRCEVGLGWNLNKN